MFFAPKLKGATGANRWQLSGVEKEGSGCWAWGLGVSFPFCLLIPLRKCHKPDNRSATLPKPGFDGHLFVVLKEHQKEPLALVGPLNKTHTHTHTHTHCSGTFPILSRHPSFCKTPNIWGNSWFLKRPMIEKNGRGINP